MYIHVRNVLHYMSTGQQTDDGSIYECRGGDVQVHSECHRESSTGLSPTMHHTVHMYNYNKNYVCLQSLNSSHTPGTCEQRTEGQTNRGVPTASLPATFEVCCESTPSSLFRVPLPPEQCR